MNRKPTMAALIDEYILYRRGLGFVVRDDKEAVDLRSFGRYADAIEHRGPLTIDLALQWARQSKSKNPIRLERRLGLVRGFAEHRISFDPTTEIPPKGMLGASSYPRKAPYVYSTREIASLLDAALTIRGHLRPRSYATLFGLLACSGLRISEALALTNQDVDLQQGILTIRQSKRKKERLVPLHPSAISALTNLASPAEPSVAEGLGPPREGNQSMPVYLRRGFL